MRYATRTINSTCWASHRLCLVGVVLLRVVVLGAASRPDSAAAAAGAVHRRRPGASVRNCVPPSKVRLKSEPRLTALFAYNSCSRLQP